MLEDGPDCGFDCGIIKDFFTRIYEKNVDAGPAEHAAVQAEGLAHAALEQVALDGTLEIPFGNGNEYPAEIKPVCKHAEFEMSEMPPLSLRYKSGNGCLS